MSLLIRRTTQLFSYTAFVLALVAGGAPPVLAQAPPAPGALEAFEAPNRMPYAERVRKQRLDGHYIPADINDAMRELDEITSTTSQNAYAEREEDFVVHKLYFSFGRWLGLNWSLYEGSRLSAYFYDLGVDAPDGQIEMLMRLYHRHLNGKPLDVEQLAEGYKAEKAARRRAERAGANGTGTPVTPGTGVGNGNSGGG